MLNCKKYISLLFLVGFCFLLGACSSVSDGGKGDADGALQIQEEEEAEKTGGTAGSAEGEPVTIGISIYRYEDNFMKLYREELKQYLVEKYGAEVVMRNARDDRTEQISQVSDFLASGCDAVIVNLVETDDAPAIADQCREAGVPLVFINREPDPAEQERWNQEKMKVSYIGTDSSQAGTYQGEIILETKNRGDFNGDGIVSYVMIMGESNHTDAESRTMYSIKALVDGGMKTEAVYAERGDWEEGRGKEIAAKALATYGSRIEVIFCNNDAMLSGALAAAQEAGRKQGKDLYLVGVDALENIVKAVRDAEVTGTVFNDHESQSHLAADVAMKLIRGEKADYHYQVDYLKITTVSTFEP